VTAEKYVFGVVCGCMCMMMASTAFAQGFVPAKGTGWAKLGYIYSQADENFAGRDEQRFAPENEDGKRVPFRARQGTVVGGKLLTHEATLDALYAPIDGLVIGGFMPVFKYAYYSNDAPPDGYSTSASRPGDLQLYSGYQLAKGARTGVTMYGKVKLPTSFKYPYTNEAIAGEGQVDASAALGLTSMILPNLALNGTLEFKYRFGWVGNGDDPDGLFADPGEELHASLGLGYGATSWLWLSGGYSGFEGTPWQIQYFNESEPIARVERSFHAATLGAYITFGQWIGVEGLALDTFVKVPFTGTDHAAMISGGAGIASPF
jgi:hypothetical protein